MCLSNHHKCSQCSFYLAEHQCHCSIQALLVTSLQHVFALFHTNMLTVLHVFHCALTVDTDPPFHAPQPPPSSLCFSSWLFLHVSDAECCSITALTQDFQHHVSVALCCVAFQRERRPSRPSTSLQCAPSHITQIVPLFLMSISVRDYSILGGLDRDAL